MKKLLFILIVGSLFMGCATKTVNNTQPSEPIEPTEGAEGVMPDVPDVKIPEIENYRDKHLLGELENKTTKYILKYEKIAISLSNQENKSHFYLTRALEIEQRTEELKHKFYSYQDYYINKINDYETVLNLPNYSIYIPKLDFDNVQLLNENYIINEEYSLNKNRASKASHIYLQQLRLYITSLNTHRNYFQALDKLYHCSTLDNFRLGNKLYDIEINKILHRKNQG